MPKSKKMCFAFSSNRYDLSDIERLSHLGNDLNISLDLFDRFEKKTAFYIFGT